MAYLRLISRSDLHYRAGLAQWSLLAYGMVRVNSVGLFREKSRQMREPSMTLKPVPSLWTNRCKAFVTSWGVRERGRQCANRPIEDSEYCTIHLKQRRTVDAAEKP